jgi:uncharacterized repeat protein (TIGR03803 family)
MGNLLLEKSSKLYGATQFGGGTSNAGVVFVVKP